MTKSEAIKVVKEVTSMSLQWSDRCFDALMMAIEALDKERSEEMGEKTDAKPISLEIENLKAENDMMQKEYVEHIKRLEKEIEFLKGTVEGMRFAIRCNGVSGGDVG